MSFDQSFAFYYQHFPTEHIFVPERILPHGISEEVYDEVRRGYAALMAGLIAGGSWYRKGCLPILFFVSIIGIPFFFVFQSTEGMMWRRARNAAILAFRAAANGDPNYMKYLDRNLLGITTQHFDSVF